MTKKNKEAIKIIKLDDDEIQDIENSDSEATGFMEFLKVHNKVTYIEIEDEDKENENTERRNNGKKDKKDISFLRQFITLKVYLVGILTGVIMVIFNIAYSVNIPEKVDDNSERKSQDPIIKYIKKYPALMIAVVCVISPVIEEIIFRKMIFGYIRRCSCLLGYVISCCLFAFFHFGFNFNRLADELWYLPVYFFFGLILTFAYDETNCILTSMIAHIINNGLSAAEILYM